MSDADRKPLMDAAESETLRMRGNSMHGNRETLETPTPQGAGRSRKADAVARHARFQEVRRSHSTDKRQIGSFWRLRASGNGAVPLAMVVWQLAFGTETNPKCLIPSRVQYVR